MSQTVDAMGKQCPIPVVMARQALQGMQTPDTLVVLVDNEVAVQNLTKLAVSCHLPVRAEKLGDKRFEVTMYMEKWKSNGMMVIPVVSSAALAIRMERFGADAVVAEGTESGGHVGEMTTMTLVPKVVDSVNIPVIAAGGIADGRQLAAAFALGAAGVQMGTCLLASTECPIHDNYKQAILKAKDNDTIVTGRIAGTPVRVLKNEMSREYVKQEKAGADKMELEKYTLGSLRKAVFDGDTMNGSLMAGQVAGQIDKIQPIEKIFEQIYEEYEAVRKELYAD